MTNITAKQSRPSLGRCLKWFQGTWTSTVVRNPATKRVQRPSATYIFVDDETDPIKTKQLRESYTSEKKKMNNHNHMNGDMHDMGDMSDMNNMGDMNDMSGMNDMMNEMADDPFCSGNMGMVM